MTNQKRDKTPRVSHFRAMVATDRPDLNNEVFSTDALTKASKGAVDVPVTVNFDMTRPIGRARITHEDSGNLYAEGQADIPEELGLVFCVPGGIIKKIHSDENDVKVIDDFSISCFGLTDSPADPHVTPIIIIPDKES